MKKILTFLIVAFATVNAAFAQDYVIGTTKASVNLREKPSTSAAVVGKLDKFTLLPGFEYEEGWYPVEYNGKRAYVSETVAYCCDANIPAEMIGKTIESGRNWDDVRFSGDITLHSIDKKHVLIMMNWMRAGLPAESWNYIGEYVDGHLTAKWQLPPFIDEDASLQALMEDATVMDTPQPVGFDEFNNAIYFMGAEFSEFN